MHALVASAGLAVAAEAAKLRSAGAQVRQKREGARPPREPRVATAVSQWEREAIGERTRDAMGHKRSQGERVGKNVDHLCFVVEADEYDTAFFDKRSKFVHYRPTVAILNNLEFDHADIFPDLTAIETQFHHFVRTVPHRGRLIVNGGEESLRRVLARGCWSEVERFAQRIAPLLIPAEAAAGADRGRRRHHRRPDPDRRQHHADRPPLPPAVGAESLQALALDDDDRAGNGRAGYSGDGGPATSASSTASRRRTAPSRANRRCSRRSAPTACSRASA